MSLKPTKAKSYRAFAPKKLKGLADWLKACPLRSDA